MTRLAALVAAILAAAPVRASDPVDFTGTWRLDARASDSIDPLLVALDRSWLERQAARMATPTQELTQTDGELTVVLAHPLGTRSERFPLNGEAVTVASPLGGTVTWSSMWSADGHAIVTSGVLVTERGLRGDLCYERSLDDDGRMVLDVRFGPDGREAITARRVFDRVR